METLTIGQVARPAGVGVETVRFYEREGLLEESPRHASGYRQYSEPVVKRIHFIKHAQQLGFSLKEITELLMLRVDGQTSCEGVKHHTEAKIAEVERKLIELQRMRQASWLGVGSAPLLVGGLSCRSTCVLRRMRGGGLSQPPVSAAMHGLLPAQRR